MRRLHLLLVAMLMAVMPLSLYAAEVVEAVQPVLSGNWIVDIFAMIAALLGTAITAYTTMFLAKKKAEVAARLENETLTKVERIQAEAELIIYDVVGNINKQYLPTLVKAVKNKEITSKDDLKHKLRSLGDEALKQVVSVGAQRGIDIVKTLGTEWVITKIRSVVDERSPFLGDTAESLLNGGADWLINLGKDWAAKRGIAVTDESAVIIIPDGHAQEESELHVVDAAKVEVVND